MRLIIAMTFLLTPLFLIVTGCDKNGDCVIADSVVLIATHDDNGTRYRVYQRISGFNEKERFFELYDSEPAFDACGQPSSPPVSVGHDDDSAGSLQEIRVISDRLELIYANRPSAGERSQVPVVFE